MQTTQPCNEKTLYRGVFQLHDERLVEPVEHTNATKNGNEKVTDPVYDNINCGLGRLNSVYPYAEGDMKQFLEKHKIR